MLPLEVIFFLQFKGKIFQPVLNPVRKAEATVRLFTQCPEPARSSGRGPVLVPLKSSREFAVLNCSAPSFS
jgi:hypothetical protein